jgi:hypothetical protein
MSNSHTNSLNKLILQHETCVKLTFFVYEIRINLNLMQHIIFPFFSRKFCNVFYAITIRKKKLQRINKKN